MRKRLFFAEYEPSGKHKEKQYSRTLISIRAGSAKKPAFLWHTMPFQLPKSTQSTVYRHEVQTNQLMCALPLWALLMANKNNALKTTLLVLLHRFTTGRRAGRFLTPRYDLFYSSRRFRDTFAIADDRSPFVVAELHSCPRMITSRKRCRTLLDSTIVVPSWTKTQVWPKKKLRPPGNADVSQYRPNELSESPHVKIRLAPLRRRNTQNDGRGPEKG